MKYFIAIFPLLTVLSITAQQPLTFKDVLKTANEIRITDSLLIDLTIERVLLDETTSKIFYKIIETKDPDSNLTENYCIAGKITSHKNFDILLLYNQRSTFLSYFSDPSFVGSPKSQSIIKELFFILFDKEGNYKNIFLAAMDYQKEDYAGWKTKTNSRKINTWVYPDLKINQQSTTESKSSNNSFYQAIDKADTKSFNFSMEYRINDYGVLVAYPKYKRD